MALMLRQPRCFTRVERAPQRGDRGGPGRGDPDRGISCRHWFVALEKLVTRKRLLFSFDLIARAAEWERAGLETPHGRPIELRSTAAPGRAVTTEERLDRMRRTPDDVAAAILEQPEDVLAGRPAEGAWSATEIVCHLCDVEEFYLERVLFILTNDEPTLVVLNPDRWADERQYRRQDIVRAHAAFTARRRETLGVLDALLAEQWERVGLHPLRGRLSVRRIVHGWAKHDDGHLDQLKRALAGFP